MQRTRRALLRLLAVGSAAGLAGCGGGGDDDQPPTDREPVPTGGGPTEGTTGTVADGTPGTEIEIVSTRVFPLRLAVEPGTTVTWVNRDEFEHDVVARRFHEVAEPWSFESEPVAEDRTITYTFEEPGVYEYTCSLHNPPATKCGAVLVGGATLEEPLPC